MTDWSSPRSDPRAIPSGRRAGGRLRVPASKSVTHRYFNLALLAGREIVVERPLLADDTRLFLDGLTRCGWIVAERQDDEVRLTPPAAGAPASVADRAPSSAGGRTPANAGGEPAADHAPLSAVDRMPSPSDSHTSANVGGGLAADRAPLSADDRMLSSSGGRTSANAGGEPVEIFCGNAGTLLRFLTASLSVLPGRWRLDGTARLRERPIGPLVAALRGLGAAIRHTGRPGCVPIEIVGGGWQGAATRLDAGESSQYLSALLMAALAAPRPIVVEVSSLTSIPYVEVTLAAVRRCGGHIEALGEGGRPPAYRVTPGLRPPPRLRVEGDASAACYPAAAAALTGGTVYLDGLGARSPQGDRGFFALLAAMGAEVTWNGDEVTVRGDHLQGVDVDLSAMPDQVPTLAALAPFARGTTRITGVAHLRLKESDRLAAMATELRRLGAQVMEGADWLEIAGTWSTAPPPDDEVTVETYGDHRIAMSLALVGLRRPGVAIASPEVVSKSYPDFWRDFGALLHP
jgi:3-phosphoshikimate 1-carboxyvinyltransferase